MPELFSVSVHNGPDDEKIVYACDENLLGKTIKENNLVLDINEQMYGGTLVDENEIIELLSMASSFTIVGEKIVNLAISRRLIHPDSVLKIGGIPYAMYISIY